MAQERLLAWLGSAQAPPWRRGLGSCVLCPAGRDCSGSCLSRSESYLGAQGPTVHAAEGPGGLRWPRGCAARVAGDGTAWHICAMRLLACASISYYISIMYVCCVWVKWPRGCCNELFSPFQRERPLREPRKVRLKVATFLASVPPYPYQHMRSSKRPQTRYLEVGVGRLIPRCGPANHADMPTREPAMCALPSQYAVGMRLWSQA